VYARVFFPNGYGASIVRHEGSYGGKDGLYEFAVLEGDKSKWEISYTTPVADDGVGYLDEAGVEALLNRVEQIGEAVVSGI
jgi:hypothetical protein